ncbi:hypothetical protein HBI38_105650 [Parastagonospora nodorum]|nr:hypothetical protein HBI38_105650 [Parastagonospora nodorum]
MYTSCTQNSSLLPLTLQIGHRPSAAESSRYSHMQLQITAKPSSLHGWPDCDAASITEVESWEHPTDLGDRNCIRPGVHLLLSGQNVFSVRQLP